MVPTVQGFSIRRYLTLACFTPLLISTAFKRMPPSLPLELVSAYNGLIEHGYNKQVIPKRDLPNLLSAVTTGKNS